MAYLPKEIRQKIINRINENISINNISKELNLAKSTIYYHYRKIKGKKFKDIEFNFKSKKEIGEFLGIFSGDGNFTLTNYKHKIRIYTGYYEKEYANNLEEFLSKGLKKKPWRWDNKSVIILQYSSKKLYNFIQTYLKWEGKKTYTIRLSNLNHSKEFFIGFLKGLYDTDGSYNKSKNTVAFYTVSNNLASQIEFILKDKLRIKYGKYINKREGRSPLHQIQIYGKNSHNILRILNPRNPNKNITNNL